MESLVDIITEQNCTCCFIGKLMFYAAKTLTQMNSSFTVDAIYATDKGLMMLCKYDVGVFFADV